MIRCTLCNSKSITGDSHHIIPREYGGSDGPEINICPTCHHSLHRCIGKPNLIDEFLSIMPYDKRDVGRKLIQAIENAKVSGVQGELVNLTIKIPRDLHNKLKLIAEDRRDSIGKLVCSLLERLIK